MISTPIPVTGEALLILSNDSSSPKPASISTGIRKLDALLDGGLRAGEVLELYGKSNTGKTQLCHKIISAISCRVEKDIATLYLDLHNNFSAKRYVQYTTLHPHENPRLDDSIRLVREVGVDGVMNTLNSIEAELRDCTSEFFERLRVVIIDGIPFALYAVMDVGNPGRETQEKFVEMLRKLGVDHQLTFIIINHAVPVRHDAVKKGHPPDPGRNTPASQIRIRSALGKYWAHIPNVRILMSRGSESESGPFGPAPKKSDTFRATLEKTGHGQPHRYFDFVITEDDII